MYRKELQALGISRERNLQRIRELAGKLSGSEDNDWGDDEDWSVVCKDFGIELEAEETNEQEIEEGKSEEDSEISTDIISVRGDIRVLRKLLKVQRKMLGNIDTRKDITDIMECQLDVERFSKRINKKLTEMFPGRINQNVQATEKMEIPVKAPKKVKRYFRKCRQVGKEILKGDTKKPAGRRAPVCLGSIWRCPMCDYKRPSQGAVYTHMCYKHGLDKFRCNLCNFQSPNKASMTNHKKRHEMDENFGRRGK